jgi:hypothetical protein
VLARVRGKPASLAGELFARECAEDLTGSPVPHHSATL